METCPGRMRNQVCPLTLPNLLGVSEKAITQLAKSGIIAPAPSGRYHLQASVYDYCAFLQSMMGRTEEVESSREHATLVTTAAKDQGGTPR
jgi:hypothetical protein